MEECDAQLHLRECRPEKGVYPGTVELFAAVLTGALACGAYMERAVEAASFVQQAVARTDRMGTDSRYGVQFEGILYRLAQIEV